MKRKMQHLRQAWAAIMTIAGLFSIGPSVNAQLPDLNVNTFDDNASTAGFWLWWGGIQREFAWDAAVDAGGNSNSGSIRLSVVYDNSNGDNQYCFGMSLAGRSAYNGALVAFPSDYTALAFDILWDSTSTVT